ncbi:MAG: Arsenical pump-driving ATPase [Firmicutes bacterium ADurb.Bin182]|nr:MAG: Arsenical pump-driving ATPase [Firmicutes bacterium ADurb.Bin182]
MFQVFDLEKINLTKYLFFTGKGGVGKTSVACAMAVSLADQGKKVLLISTDPASNLQDVFETDLNSTGVEIAAVPNLLVANLDPVRAAADYKESVVAPYRGILPDTVIKNMEEQLSGACTVEIAAFNEFTAFLADKETESKYDYIIFDTAPTGHTLRMLQLPSAWTNFISENTYGASCLGQLSGLEEKKDSYKQAVETLSDKNKTTLMLVSTPESTPLAEASRASNELKDIGIKNQMLLLNGVLFSFNENDDTEKAFYKKQQAALNSMPEELKTLTAYQVPLRAYNIIGVSNVRRFLKTDDFSEIEVSGNIDIHYSLKDVVQDIFKSNKRVIFTMGKGGVGKTSIAAAVALGLSEKGKRVHLATTDPAAHLQYVISQSENITVSNIDEEKELAKYKEEVLSKARETMSEDDLAYIEEDLRSPCTQEIAVFRAFAEIVDRSENEVVVIDTAPTGHTLLLLDATQSYHREVKRTQGEVEEAVKKLLPRLRNPNETQVIIVTLPEATPVFEAMRLVEDLDRAGINSKWWIVNKSIYLTATSSSFLKAKASNEVKWIQKVAEISKGNYAVIAWKPNEIKGENLKEL